MTLASLFLVLGKLLSTCREILFYGSPHIVEPRDSLFNRACHYNPVCFPIKVFNPAQIKDAVSPYQLQRVAEHLMLPLLGRVRCV